MTRGPDIDFSIPEQLNLASYFLEENISRGRGDKVAIYYRDEKYSFSDVCRLTNKVGNVLKELATKVLMIQAKGDYQAAKDLIAKYVVLSPSLKLLQGKLDVLPVDIKPIYEIEQMYN